MEWHEETFWRCQCYCSINHEGNLCCDYTSDVVTLGWRSICLPCVLAIPGFLADVKRDLVRILYSS